MCQVSEVPSDGKRGNKISTFKKEKKGRPREHRPASLAFVPGKIMEEIQKTMLRYMENKVVIADSQHGFTKSKLCLTNLVAFYNGVTAVVDEVNGITCLDLCTAFNTILRNILVSFLFLWFYIAVYILLPT